MSIYILEVKADEKGWVTQRNLRSKTDIEVKN